MRFDIPLHVGFSALRALAMNLQRPNASLTFLECLTIVLGKFRALNVPEMDFVSNAFRHIIKPLLQKSFAKTFCWPSDQINIKIDYTSSYNWTAITSVVSTSGHVRFNLLKHVETLCSYMIAYILACPFNNVDHRRYEGAKTFGHGRLQHNVSNTKVGARNSSTNSRSSYSRQWQGKASVLREAVSIWQLGFSQVDELRFSSAGTLSYFKWYLSRSTIPTAQTRIPYQQHANVTRPSPTRAWTRDF